MILKPIKLKDLLEQAKNPKVQQIEIVEDYVLSVKTVFEGVVKDVPEEMLSKYYISDWYPEEGTPVLVVLVWVNPHEEFNKYAENSNSDSHRITIHYLMANGCCTNPYIDFAIVNIKTGEVLLDRVSDKTNSKSGDEEWIHHCKYEPYKDWKVREWRLVDRKMQLYISR